MKRVALILLFLASFSIGEDHYTSCPDWRARMLESVRELSADGGDESIDRLGAIVRKLSLPRHQERPERPVFLAAQEALLAIPGHAGYFSDRIRAAYELFKGAEGRRHFNLAHSAMITGFRTLRHLPSPETVKVMGEMLSETWRMDPPPPVEGEMSYRLYSLALGAVNLGFQHLPLRDPPMVPPVTIGKDSEETRLPPWQEWYEEVKSGKRAFSFKGQPVEYRFKPDGTWETIALADPPDDGPDTTVTATPPRPSAQAPPADTASDAKGRDESRGWIIVAVLATLGSLVWLAARKARRKR